MAHKNVFKKVSLYLTGNYTGQTAQLTFFFNRIISQHLKLLP